MGSIEVTDKKIPLDEALYNKIKLMILRCTQPKPKLDNVVTVEGGEGTGKTTMASLIGYIVHDETGRPFSEANVFADIQEGVDFAQNTEEQIIIFDEPALEALSSEWWKEAQRNMVKLLMLARKKRHFIIFNITKFYKFSEYIVVDRAVGMIHIYNDPVTNQPRWTYIPKKYLELLANDYRTKKQRNYKKYTILHGTFPDVLDPSKPYNILDHFNTEIYDKRKDKAIQSIGKKAESDAHALKLKIGSLTYPVRSMSDMANKLKISKSTIHAWVKKAGGNVNKDIESED